MRAKVVLLSSIVPFICFFYATTSQTSHFSSTTTPQYTLIQAPPSIPPHSLSPTRHTALDAVPSSLGFQRPFLMSFRSNAESSCQDDSDDNTQSPSHNNAVSISLGFHHPPQTSFRRNAESSCKAHSDDNTQLPPQQCGT